jgi:hypothetical protein
MMQDTTGIAHAEAVVTKSSPRVASKTLLTKSSEPISTDLPRFQLARIAEVEARLRDLAAFEKQFAKAKRRFRLRAFISWQTAADERKRRAQHDRALQRT